MPEQIGSEDSLYVEIGSDVLDAVVNPPVELTKEKKAIFRWTEDKLVVGAMDGARVMSVTQTIESDEFDIYQVDLEDEELPIGVACGKVANLLEEADSNDTIKLELCNDTNKLDLSFGEVSYSLAPKEISSINEPPQNEIDHEITVWTHSGVFRRSNKILSMADEEIVFNFTDDGVYVSASGDADSAEINLEASDEDNQDGADIVFDEKKKELQARFSSDYIEYIPKFTPNGLFKSNFDSKNPLEINTRRVEEKILTQIRLAQRLQPEG